MSGADVSPGDDPRRREVAVSISIRPIVLVGAAVALAWELTGVGQVLLLILVSLFSIAVLAPEAHRDRRLEPTTLRAPA